jgi:hypothetical protein
MVNRRISIATAVAIVVAVAAIAYVWATEPESPPGPAPLLDLAWGPSSNITSPHPTTGCTPNRECYAVQIASCGEGVTPGVMAFSLRNTAGTTIRMTGEVTLVSSGGGSLALWNATNSTWLYGSNVQVNAGWSFVYNPETAPLSLEGDTLLVIGMGPFTGYDVSAPLPH